MATQSATEPSLSFSRLLLFIYWNCFVFSGNLLINLILYVASNYIPDSINMYTILN